ncbi:hypothetical protein CC78DRAFT_583206 [Lojkania enalia]|uniref:Uncharacterized protein n=1 Tax=Lojkania enalia TaxID=147567 RepID=A0A9P4K6G2_9PLEO|nr:hypothetical protein CC78DRAFT_583206 [Didymosphaeria enalia]
MYEKKISAIKDSIHRPWYYGLSEEIADAIQCFGWGTANNILPYSKGLWQSPPLDHQPLISNLFEDRGTDGCRCKSSLSGCTFATSFRGLTKSFMRIVLTRDELLLLVISVFARPVENNRLLLGGLLRCLTFWQLGLRHTCCDIKRAWEHYGYHGILDEDAFLAERLEKLVEELEAEYHASGKGMEEFVKVNWRAKMKKELDRQTKLDEEEYGQLRREMGIILARSDSDIGFVGEGSIEEIESDENGESEDHGNNLIVELSDEEEEFFEAVKAL